MTPARTVADLLDRINGLPPRRVLLSPEPGQATEADLLARSREGRELYELVQGVLVEKPMGAYASFIAMELVMRFLGPFVLRHDLGILLGADGLIRYAPRTVRIPDLSYYSWARLPGRQFPALGILDIVPDLAVEVLSEGNTPAEINEKIREYLAAGTRLVWIIDPTTRTARAITSAGETAMAADGTLDGGDVLPGFAMPLAELFARVAAPTP